MTWREVFVIVVVSLVGAAVGNYFQRHSVRSQWWYAFGLVLLCLLVYWLYPGIVRLFSH